MSGIPPNGAQRASRQAAGGVTLGLPRKNRHRSVVVVGQIILVTALIFSQLFVDPGLDSAEAATRPVLVSAATLRTKPMSGAAWKGLKAVADQAVGTLTLSDQDENSDITVLAKALVYARTGTVSYRTAVIAALKAAKGTEVGGRTLALGRNLPGLVIAADLISLKTADPAFNDKFRPWLRSLLTKVLDERTLIDIHEHRPNNWGTHAGAARVAIAAYLGDTVQMARAAKVFHGWVGSRATYAGFKYDDDLSWQCDPTKPVGINPTGCMKAGVSIDGVIPDDMRRGGSFRWPPNSTGYPWENLQGALLQAELLRVAGYDSWNWENRALLRAVRFLYNRAKWPATGDDEWQTWLLDARYGTNYKLAPPVRYGKNFGFTDWIYGPSISGGTDPTPTPTPAPTPTPTPTPPPTPIPGTATVGTTEPSTRIPGGLSFAAGTVPLATSWQLTGDATTLAQFQLQRSIDGGTWANVTLDSATATSAIVAVTPGRAYRYRARAFDNLGRASPWVTGPTVTASVAQETAASYTGTWVVASHPDYLGGDARASQTKGSKVTFTFDGPSFGLVGPTGPTRGKAEVYMDGELLITIDTYSASFRPRRVLQTIFTSDASHTVTVRVLATSGRPWFAVDAFFVMQRQ
jgi:hypothetical protein